MAEIKSFSYSEAIKFGWEITKKHFWFVLAVLLISYGVQAFFSYIGGYLFSKGDLSQFLINIAGYIVGLELSFATTKIGLQLIDNKKPEIGDLFAYFQAKPLFYYFLVGLLVGLAFGIGFVLFIVPGVYFGVKYGFAPIIYADKQPEGYDAFTKSAELTNGIKWKLLGFWVLLFLINIAGAMALGVGLLVTIPVTYLAQLYVYRKLDAHHKLTK